MSEDRLGEQMQGRLALWSNKAVHQEWQPSLPASLEVLVQPGPGQAALELGGLLCGVGLLTDEPTVKSCGDNKAKDPGFLPRSFWPTLLSFTAHGSPSRK